MDQIFIHSFVPQDESSDHLAAIKCPVSVSQCSVMVDGPEGELLYWVTVTCCIFLIDGKVFIPWGGYREPWMSVGLRDPGTGRGLTEPGSLCTDPPLPSDWPSFFLIIFLSLALRFWNQIFTWQGTNERGIQLIFNLIHRHDFLLSFIK